MPNAQNTPQRLDFTVLRRLIPIDAGLLFVVGDRGLLYGDGDLEAISAAHGLRHLERARDPWPTLWSLNIYDRPGAKYGANMQILTDDRRGWVFALLGDGFYRVMEAQAQEVFKQTETDVLLAYVMPGHSRLMARALRRVCRVDVLGSGEMNGFTMDWVSIRPLS